MAEPTLDEVIRVYVAMRDEKAAKKRAFDESVKELTENMSKLEGFIKSKLQEMNVDSVKTSHGTAFTTRQVFVGVADWDSVIDYIKSTGDFGILNHAVNKTAVNEYVADKGTPPPGVKVDSFIKVAVRRTSK